MMMERNVEGDDEKEEEKNKKTKKKESLTDNKQNK